MIIDMYIDSHVHCRDFKQTHKETIAHALEVAKDSGLSAVFDMPNTNPPVTTRKRVLERLALAESCNSPVFYGTYIGLTTDSNQIKEAVRTYNECFPKGDRDRWGVVGLKMFAGKSVGNLTISEPEAQKEVYRQLVENKYEGVLVVHCEKESEMKPELWDASRPITHCEVRPEISEIESVKDQLRFAFNEGYAKCEFSSRPFGKLHVAHISTPRAVEFVDAYRDFMHLSCGATPHHLLLNNKVMKSKIDGIMYKVNPPLRSSNSQKILLEQFKCGLIDILETDHAPHTNKEKFKDHMSGIPGLSSWPLFINQLRQKGVEDSLIEKVAYENVNKIFGTQIKKINFPFKSHVGEYAFEPYENLK